jgi:hypothetical protein
MLQAQPSRRLLSAYLGSTEIEQCSGADGLKTLDHITSLTTLSWDPSQIWGLYFCCFSISVNSPTLLSLIIDGFHSSKLQDKDPRLRESVFVTLSSLP